MGPTDVLQMIDHKYALFGLFFAFHNRLQAVGDSFYEEITCKQFFLMACLELFPQESPTANELAKVMGCSRQNVKEILNSLQKKDMVCLCLDEKDRRKQRVYRTEKAMAVAEKYRQKEESFLAHLFAEVTDEQIVSTYGVIAKIEDNLKRMKEYIE